MAGVVVLLHHLLPQLGLRLLVGMEKVMDDLLEARDEEEAGAHDDLGHGEEGVDLLVLHALPHLGQPVTETVGNQDSSTKIQ